MKRAFGDNSKPGVKKAKLYQDKEAVHNNENNDKTGLDVEIHPLLKNIGLTNIPKLPKDHNPLRQSNQKWFDPLALNPYLDQSDMVINNKKSRHIPPPLKFISQGKYVAQGEKLREKLKVEHEQTRELEAIKQQGLIPDETIGEQLYQLEVQPLIEWWDRPYLRDNNYMNINDESRKVLDDETQPITSYIQHPVLINPIWETKDSNSPIQPVYLTKKEQKRIRKNERQLKQQEKQDRIKLGLDPPPPPKVKLSNLMNVLTNESIKDPTAVENRVKREIQQRVDKHLAQNEARKLTKEQKHEKLWNKQEKDLANGIHTTVYKIDKLVNPKHLFKLNISAQEENLVGVCLKNPKFNLVIVEGGEKSIGHYKKLMMKRIKWTENVSQSATNDPIDDLSNNKCSLVWEGSLPDVHFQKWSIMYSRDDEEALTALKKFDLENYWRLASSLKE